MFNINNSCCLHVCPGLVNPGGSFSTIIGGSLILMHLSRFNLFGYVQASKRDLDIQPHEESPMDLDTYLQDFKKSDEWEIIANESIRAPSPREWGELLVFSRRTALR